MLKQPPTVILTQNAQAEISLERNENSLNVRKLIRNRVKIILINTQQSNFASSMNLKHRKLGRWIIQYTFAFEKNSTGLNYISNYLSLDLAHTL